MEKARPHILFALLITMVFGLLFSRALLSVAMIGFIMASLLHQQAGSQLRNFLRQPLFIGTSLLFILPLLSGLWSEEKRQWLDMMQVKLPLLLLPVSFAWPLGFSKKHWDWLIGIFIVLVFITAAYSLVDYFSYQAFYDKQYLEGGGIHTALEDDHVRFSLLCFMAIIFCARTIYLQKGKGWAWTILLIFFILYLHLLAARTGLLAFYFALALSAVFLWAKSAGKWGAAMLMALIIIPVGCWFLLPSFKHKLQLFRYEMSYFQHGSYVPFSNDMVRGVSLRAGWGIMKKHPLLGAGYGDISNSTGSWYQENYPQIREADKIYPSSQYLMYGAGIGLLGLFVFIGAMALPFFIKGMDSLPWISVNAGLALSYLFDIGLEVQFGVFIHCFILFVSWQWMQRQNTTSL